MEKENEIQTANEVKVCPSTQFKCRKERTQTPLETKRSSRKG